MKIVRAIVMSVLLCALAMQVHGQNYPNKSVRLIVPFPPGGGTDLIARTVGQGLSEIWRQQVVIDNRGGAGGTIGTQLAAQAAADGYTLLLGSSSGLVLNPLLSPNLPYDAKRDFTGAGMLAINPTILIVTNSVPAHSVRDLIALAQSRPGQLNYASGGPGSMFHLAAELFKIMTSTNIIHVPYKGTVLAMPDLLAGQVQMTFTAIPIVLPLIKAAKLRALAVGSGRRSLAVPDIPTVAEAGVPDFEAVSWFGLFAPQQTPNSIIAKLGTDAAQVLANPETVQLLLSQGSEPRSSSPQELKRYVQAESMRWEK